MKIVKAIYDKKRTQNKLNESLKKIIEFKQNGKKALKFKYSIVKKTHFCRKIRIEMGSKRTINIVHSCSLHILLCVQLDKMLTKNKVTTLQSRTSQELFLFLKLMSHCFAFVSIKFHSKKSIQLHYYFTIYCLLR